MQTTENLFGGKTVKQNQNDAMLSIRDVRLSYGGRTVVEGVSFELMRGEILCLIGANGSGKSTLIKGILGLMPVHKGRIEMNCGREKIAYLAQLNTAERDFPATVWEIVLSGRQMKGRRLPFYTREDRLCAEEAMKLLKIDQFANMRIGNLSGGQQQRVLLARAIARKPEVLILDEPCSALDPAITAELYSLFDQLREQLSLSILISTHDWHYVEQSGDRVMVLNHEIEFIGSKHEWLEWRGGRR
jgi:zinc transport system ATP-binding protein